MHLSTFYFVELVIQTGHILSMKTLVALIIEKILMVPSIRVVVLGEVMKLLE